MYAVVGRTFQRMTFETREDAFNMAMSLPDAVLRHDGEVAIVKEDDGKWEVVRRFEPIGEYCRGEEFNPWL